MSHDLVKAAFHAVPLLGRGVFIAPYLSARGRPLLVAVDSKGRKRRVKAVGPRANVRELKRMLRGLLDLLDPQSPRSSR